MVSLCLVFTIYSCFGDQISALLQKFLLDLLPNCYSHRTENLSGQSLNFNTYGEDKGL